jgi:hypothetical protein
VVEVKKVVTACTVLCLGVLLSACTLQSPSQSAAERYWSDMPEIERYAMCAVWPDIESSDELSRNASLDALTSAAFWSGTDGVSKSDLRSALQNLYDGKC